MARKRKHPDRPKRNIKPPNPRSRWINEGELVCPGSDCGKPIPAGWYSPQRKYYFCCKKCEGQFLRSRNPEVECVWCHRRYRRLHRGHNQPLCSPECFKAWREEPLNKKVGRFLPLLEAMIAEYRQKSPATRADLRSNLGQFLHFLVRQRVRSLNSVRPKHITAFLQELRDKGWARTNSIAGIIRTFFDWAILHEKRRLANPVVSRFHCERQPKRLPRPYTEEEMALIWKLLEESQDKALLAAVAFAAEAGCRISEVANLRLCDLDLEGQKAFIRIPNKTQTEHYVPFHTDAKQRLKAWLEVRGEHDHDFVFVGPSGRPMAKATLRFRLNRALVGEGKLPRFSFHRLRASAATRLAKAGSDILAISRTIGWANPQTADRYIKLDTADLKRSYDQAMQRKTETEKLKPVLQTMDEFFASEPLLKTK